MLEKQTLVEYSNICLTKEALQENLSFALQGVFLFCFLVLFKAGLGYKVCEDWL